MTVSETSIKKAAKRAPASPKGGKTNAVAEDKKSAAPVTASVSAKASAEPKAPRRKAAPKAEAAPKANPVAKEKAAPKAKATPKAKAPPKAQTAAKKKAAVTKEVPATKQAAPASETAAQKPKRAKKELVKKELEKKEKVVRDSFTMPKSDYAKIAALKQKCLDAGVSVKKSEVLRAGLLLLEGTTLENLLAAISAVETVKTGRPSAA
jgi:hypothetical protein